MDDSGQVFANWGDPAANMPENVKLPEWNVKLPVVTLIRAASAEAAIDLFRAQLTTAGFDVYEGEPGDAFESEETA